MARGIPFVRPAIFCALLALSLQLRAQRRPVGTPLAGRCGDIAWRNATNGGRGGLLTTARKLFFGGDGINNAPETYLLDNQQYLLTMTGDTLFAFTIY